MSGFPHHLARWSIQAVGACRRAVVTGLRFTIRVIRFLLILGLVMLPVPLVGAFVAVLLSPMRRNLPAQVLRKE